MKKKLLVWGLSLGVMAAGLPFAPPRAAEASPSSARPCCMKGDRSVCYCGVAGGCGMCRQERAAQTASEDRSGLLRLVRCPGPAEQRAVLAQSLEGVPPGLSSPQGSVAPALLRFDPPAGPPAGRCPSPDPPPPRRFRSLSA